MMQYQDALTSYRLAEKTRNDGSIADSIMEDSKYLDKAGVDPIMRDIVIDSLNE